MNSSSFVQGKNWIMFWFIIWKGSLQASQLLQYIICVFGSIGLWRFVSRQTGAFTKKPDAEGENNAWT